MTFITARKLRVQFGVGLKGILNRRVRFETLSLDLESASEVWKQRLRFETMSEVWEWASWIWKQRVELQISDLGLKRRVTFGSGGLGLEAWSEVWKLRVKFTSGDLGLEAPT